MDLKKEYCKLNGYTKFNKYNVNDYTEFLEQKLTELNQALQLLQPDVSDSFYCYDKCVSNAAEDYDFIKCKTQCKKCNF